MLDDKTARSDSSRRVLIVDDDEDMVRLLRLVLGRAGFLTIGALSALQALAILKKDSQFDVLCADLRMPTMDGLTLIEQVRVDYPHIQVVAISAWHGPDVKVSATRRGAQAFIPKPFQNESLLAVLNSVL